MTAEDWKWLQTHKQMEGNAAHDLILGRMIRRLLAYRGMAYTSQLVASMHAEVEAALLDASHAGLPNDIIRQAASGLQLEVYP